MRLPPQAEKTPTAYTMTITIRRPYSDNYVVLTCVAHGAAREDHLVEMQMASPPLDDDVLSEFETGVFSHLESSLERLVGIQHKLEFAP